VSLWIQHRLELLRRRREDEREARRAREYLALWQQLGEGMQDTPVTEVLRLGESLQRRLRKANLEDVPVERLIDLYLACQAHFLEWSRFHQNRIAAEAHRMEATSASGRRGAAPRGDAADERAPAPKPPVRS